MTETSFFDRHPSLDALRYRDFRLLLAGTAFVGLSMPLQFITQIFWVQTYYPEREVFYVGLIALSRGLAMLLFGLVGGAIADRYERRRVLLVAEIMALVLNAAIALLMVTRPLGDSTIAVLLIFTFAASANHAIDAPARTASIPSIVGRKAMGNAISLNMMARQLANPIMLPLAGLLNGLFDPSRVYVGSLLTWTFIIPLIAALRYRSRGGADAARGVLGNIVDGLVYVGRDRRIFAIVALIVAMQVLGMPGVAMLGPIWMTTVLGLTPAQFGLIASTWGIGAAGASIFYARRHGLTRRGSVLCFHATLFAVSVIVFGLSRSIPLTALMNLTLGASMVGVMVAGATITQYLVSDDVRGRVMGLFPLTMGLGMLSAGPVSAIGQAVSLERVVPILGWAMLAIVIAVMLKFRFIVTLNPSLAELSPALSHGDAGDRMKNERGRGSGEEEIKTTGAER